MGSYNAPGDSTTRRFECFDCAGQFQATSRPMVCPDCGGELRDMTLPREQ